MFAQEKYSNGETSLQYFEEHLHPNALYLSDEPEVSLSPANQVALAEFEERYDTCDLSVSYKYICFYFLLDG